MLLSRVDHVLRDRRASGVPDRRGRRADIRMQRPGTRHANRPIRSGDHRRHARTAAACAAVTDTRAGPGTTVAAGTFTTGHAEATDAATAHATTTDSAAQHGQAL